MSRIFRSIKFIDNLASEWKLFVIIPLYSRNHIEICYSASNGGFLPHSAGTTQANPLQVLKKCVSPPKNIHTHQIDANEEGEKKKIIEFYASLLHAHSTQCLWHACVEYSIYFNTSFDKWFWWHRHSLSPSFVRRRLHRYSISQREQSKYKIARNGFIMCELGERRTKSNFQFFQYTLRAQRQNWLLVETKRNDGRIRTTNARSKEEEKKQWK